MRNLYKAKYRLSGFIGGAMIFSAFFLVGCDRSDRAAVAESAEMTVETGKVGRTSKKGMYSARLDQDSITVGEPVEVAMAIEPGNDLKINLDFPWKVEFQALDGVSFSKSTFGPSEITLNEDQATVPLVLNVAKSGEYDVEAIADFSVCNDDRCEILRGETVIVKVRGVDQGIE